MIDDGWDSVLQAVARNMGEDGCCSIFDAGNVCCMTDTAKRVFGAMAAAGGPTLEECEAVARGELILARPIARGTLRGPRPSGPGRSGREARERERA